MAGPLLLVATGVWFVLARSMVLAEASLLNMAHAL
jgi:hypothetical protein